MLQKKLQTSNVLKVYFYVLRKENDCKQKTYKCKYTGKFLAKQYNNKYSNIV